MPERSFRFALQLGVLLLIGSLGPLGCSLTRRNTRLELSPETEVGLALAPAEQDPSRWLLPPGHSKLNKRLSLASPRRGLDVGALELRRKEDGSLTLLCQRCVTGWLDLVKRDEDRLLLQIGGGVAEHLRRVGDEGELEFSLIASRETRGDPEGDLQLRREDRLHLVARFPSAAVLRVMEERVRVHRRSYVTTGVLAGSGLVVGGAGLALLLQRGGTLGRGQQLVGGSLIGTGTLMLGAALWELLLPRVRHTWVELPW